MSVVDQRWLQIIDLAEQGKLQEIRTNFPREYVAKLAHLEMMAKRAAFVRCPREPLVEEDLINESIFFWGDPGTGKTCWGHSL
jgi:hypothetical protein